MKSCIFLSDLTNVTQLFIFLALVGHDWHRLIFHYRNHLLLKTCIKLAIRVTKMHSRVGTADKNFQFLVTVCTGIVNMTDFAPHALQKCMAKTLSAPHMSKYWWYYQQSDSLNRNISWQTHFWDTNWTGSRNIDDFGHVQQKCHQKCPQTCFSCQNFMSCWKPVMENLNMQSRFKLEVKMWPFLCICSRKFSQKWRDTLPSCVLFVCYCW